MYRSGTNSQITILKNSGKVTAGKSGSHHSLRISVAAITPMTIERSGLTAKNRINAIPIAESPVARFIANAGTTSIININARIEVIIFFGILISVNLNFRVIIRSLSARYFYCFISLLNGFINFEL